MLFPFLKYASCFSFQFQLGKLRQDESESVTLPHLPPSPHRSQLKYPTLLLFLGLEVVEVNTQLMPWQGVKGKAYLYQVPEEHLPILRAADHVCVTLTQAAVQLVLLVLMANIPSSEGG